MADLSGATLYVSLEPCCHEGKTPPCTEAIVQAGIRRVVVGSDDPTAEKAAGRGLAGILRDEGIDVLMADGELATRRGCSTRPSASTPASGALGALQVRHDPRRQGRHALAGDSQVDQR